MWTAAIDEYWNGVCSCSVAGDIRGERFLAYVSRCAGGETVGADMRGGEQHTFAHHQCVLRDATSILMHVSSVLLLPSTRYRCWRPRCHQIATAAEILKFYLDPPPCIAMVLKVWGRIYYLKFAPKSCNMQIFSHTRALHRTHTLQTWSEDM